MPSPSPLRVVGIGASAGGLEALKRFFAVVPAGAGVSFVIVMHLDPSRPSLLDEILARTTLLNVCPVEDGCELEPDTVYVAPPRRQVDIRDGRLHLGESKEPGATHHLIDHFFRSLAGDQGARAMAIVLSGTGSDGTIGARAVKEAGGTVFAQDENSAFFPDMPRSVIATGAADLVLPVEEMPEKILRTITCPLPPFAASHPSADSNAQLTAVFRIVKNRTGNDFSSYKISTVMRRIERRMKVVCAAGLADYVAILEQEPQEARLLCKEMLIGVTSFFRDPEAFTVLCKGVFPDLFAHRGADDPVRVWHACCSTGEEAYSMAIMILEFLKAHALTTPVLIFATDVDEMAIAYARAGHYPREAVSQLHREQVEQYFTAVDDGYRVNKQLRDMIVFAQHSLVRDPPFSRLDLLVCRNFLIYLKSDMQQRLVSMFHLCLNPDGVLFLGNSETVGRSSELFAPLDKRWKIYRRRSGDRELKTDLPFGLVHPRLTEMTRHAQTPPPGKAMADMVHKLLIEMYAPPCVVVNERYEAVFFSGRSDRFLEIPAGEPTRDILKMARKELRPVLRSAIHKVLTEQSQVVSCGAAWTDGRGGATTDILVRPLSGLPSEAKLVMVTFGPGEMPTQLSAPPECSGEELPAGEEAKDRLIRQLEEQLILRDEQLQSIIEQLESSNEGLLSTNEELLSINEEFQSTNEELHSTNEELETSREELQALNEELVTVNTELQQKVEELNQANSDMDNLLTSSGIATVFLDRQLRIKRFTPAMAELFNLIPADCDRPFRHLAGKIDWPDMEQDLTAVLAEQRTVEQETTTLKGDRSFLARILPYRTAEQETDGIVLTLIDITERKRLEARTVHLASFPELNPNPVMELDQSGTITYFNPASTNVLRSQGLNDRDATPFLPPDLANLLQDWDRTTEETHPREVTVGRQTFAATVHLAPQLHVIRLYAYDITERRRAEQAQRESEAKYRRTLDSMLEGCQIIGFDWCYRYLNGAAERHNRRPNVELLGRTMMECWPGITDTRVFTLAKNCMEERTAHQLDTEFTFPDGYAGWFRLIIQPVAEGIVIFSEDITERKRAETALEATRHQNEFLANIVARSSQPFGVGYPDGRLGLVNDAFERLTGYSGEELRSTDWLETLTPPEWHAIEQEQLAELRRTGRPVRYEKEYVRKDGRRVPVELLVHLATGAAGEPDYYYSFITDITERKESERALRESEERVRRKLDSILTPAGDTGALELADVIDTDTLQLLVNDFYKLSGMPMGLIDIKGKVLVGVGWQEICTKFHRVNPETCQNCVESDIQLAAGVPPGEYKIYKCKNNLWDVATPVMVGGSHLGNLFMGQFFFDDESNDEAFFRSQARRYGFDEQEYIDCLKAVPRLSREQLATSMSFFMRLAGILSRLGYSNLKLARSLTQGETLTKELRNYAVRLGLLAETAGRLLVSDSPQKIVDELCHDVMTFLDCQAFFNFLVDEPSGRLRLNACAGIPDEERRKIEWLDYGAAVCGCAARDACRIVAENIAETPDPRTELVNSYGIQAYACHPLMVEGRVLGTISFGTCTRPSFSEDDLSLMKAVADHVAIAMERKRSLESLREQEEVYSAIVNNAADGIVLVDPKTLSFVEFNDAACAGLGYSREEFAALTLLDIHDQETAVKVGAEIRSGDSGDCKLHTDHQHLHKDGTSRAVRVNSRLVTVKGHPHLLSIWHDITERKQIEEEREKTARLDSLGILAGGIAHDFNNILTAVIGNMSLARMKLGDSHPVAQQLDSCGKALDKATGLTRQLLTFARGGVPVKDTVATEHLLREVVSFSLHGSNCRGELEIAPGIWPLHADAAQVHQALNNLIINAVQAMPDGGVVTVAASNEAVTDGSKYALPSGRYVKITVADQGIGITADNVQRIFDPYFTTKETGTGLGLASVYSIVNRHGGSIDVASVPGRGTVFTILLPADDRIGARTSHRPDDAPSIQAAPPETSVLLMDDEEMIRSLAVAMLEGLGYRTVTCADGSEAVETYQQYWQQGTPFSVVILDMTVPGGMGGREAAKRILAINPDAVLVVSTGYSVDIAYSGRSDSVFRGAVAKPYNIKQLAQELARLTAPERHDGPEAPDRP